MDDKQPARMFYECLKQGIKNQNSVSKKGRKIIDFCLKQGQGMRGRAAPLQPKIYIEYPPPRGSNTVFFYPEYEFSFFDSSRV